MILNYFSASARLQIHSAAAQRRVLAQHGFRDFVRRRVRQRVNAPSGAVLPKELVGSKSDKFLANFVF